MNVTLDLKASIAVRFRAQTTARTMGHATTELATVVEIGAVQTVLGLHAPMTVCMLDFAMKVFAIVTQVLKARTVRFVCAPTIATDTALASTTQLVNVILDGLDSIAHLTLVPVIAQTMVTVLMEHVIVQ